MTPKPVPPNQIKTPSVSIGIPEGMGGSQEDQQIPTWQKVVAGLYVLVLVLLLFFFNGRIPDDFIPLDKSTVGPNILAEWVTILVGVPVGALLWPPVRRRIRGEINAVHAKLDNHFAQAQKERKEAREHREWSARSIARLAEHAGAGLEDHPHFDLSSKDASS